MSDERETAQVLLQLRDISKMHLDEEGQYVDLQNLCNKAADLIEKLGLRADGVPLPEDREAELPAYEDTLSAESARKVLRDYLDRWTALMKAIRDVPEWPPGHVLLELGNMNSKFSAEGKRAQALGAPIPYKAECEWGAGLWARIRDALREERHLDPHEELRQADRFASPGRFYVDGDTRDLYVVDPPDSTWAGDKTLVAKCATGDAGWKTAKTLAASANFVRDVLSRHKTVVEDAERHCALDLSDEARALIRDTPALTSLLYDLDLLPEQLESQVDKTVGLALAVNRLYGVIYGWRARGILVDTLRMAHREGVDLKLEDVRIQTKYVRGEDGLVRGLVGGGELDAGRTSDEDSRGWKPD